VPSPLLTQEGAMFKEQYKRVKELGSGAFGAAYLVHRRDTKDLLLVAKTVKLLHLPDDEQKTALQEAKYLGRLSHPNIIAYVTSLLEERKLHIIMEYADRGFLPDKIKWPLEEQRPISESSIMRYFIETAQALEHIHSCNILHRDVKPKNIFLMGPDEQVKLGDFGVARIFDEAGAQTQIGTPHYIAPEVLNMDGYGTNSELWSLGVVAYELMSLRVPFQAPSLPGIAMTICGATPEPLPQRYSQPFRRTTMSLLEKEPKRRPSLKDLLRAPRNDNDLWAVEVTRLRRKMQRRVESDCADSARPYTEVEQEGARPRRRSDQESASGASLPSGAGFREAAAQQPRTHGEEVDSCASSRPSSASRFARAVGERPSTSRARGCPAAARLQSHSVSSAPEVSSAAGRLGGGRRSVPCSDRPSSVASSAGGRHSVAGHRHDTKEARPKAERRSSAGRAVAAFGGA